MISLLPAGNIEPLSLFGISRKLSVNLDLCPVLWGLILKRQQVSQLKKMAALCEEILILLGLGKAQFRLPGSLC